MGTASLPFRCVPPLTSPANAVRPSGNWPTLASDSTEFEAFTAFDPEAFWFGFGTTVTCFFVGFGNRVAGGTTAQDAWIT